MHLSSKIGFFRKEPPDGNVRDKGICHILDTVMLGNNLFRYLLLGVEFSLLLYFILKGYLLSFENILLLFNQGVIVAILAIGVMFPIIIKGFDFSSNAICGLSSLLIVALVPYLPIILVIILVLAISCLIGFANGFLITKLKIPSFVITLVTSTILTATSTYYLGDDHYIPVENPRSGYVWLYGLMTHKVLGIDPRILVLFLLIGIAMYVLKRTYLGRCLYAVGFNEEKAQKIGIPVVKVKILAFMISALVAGLGAILLIFRINGGQILGGTSYEMFAIALVYMSIHTIQNGRGDPLPILFHSFTLVLLRFVLMNMNINGLQIYLPAGLLMLVSIASGQKNIRFSKRERAT